jgi:G patch domain-containing protein 1
VLTNGPAMHRPAWMGQASAAPEKVQTVEHAIVDVERNDAVAKERAPDDVFRAIFGDDDDDEDE